MTTKAEVAEAEHVSNSYWLVVLTAFGVPAAFLFSLIVVVASALSGEVLVDDRADLKIIGFGWPIAWVHQDQGSFDPPLPFAQGFISPWEYPTTVSSGTFLVDVLVVFAVVGVLLLLTAALVMALVRGLRNTRRLA